MNIYTRKGDTGETSLYGGTRVSKSDLRVWCYGTVDEANSLLGLIHASLEFDDLKALVRAIQERLFVVCSELASDAEGLGKLKTRLAEGDITELESLIDGFTSEFGKLNSFTIPGETQVSALFHFARTVVRRAERYVVELGLAEPLPPLTLRYLNRLSDALYIMAKMEVHRNFIRRVAERLMGDDKISANDANAANYDVIDATAANDAMTANDANETLGRKLFERFGVALENESTALGVRFSLAVVDAGANLLFFCRQSGAILASGVIAQNKAYTSAVMGMSTGELRNEALPGGSLYGINTADPRIVVFGGGFPLFDGRKLAGAIGVSGGTVAQDEQAARKIIEIFNRRSLWNRQ